MKKHILKAFPVIILIILSVVSCPAPAGPSSDKAITAYSFTSPAATGTIDETAKTIAVAVPFGTSPNGLVATFTTTGASVKVGTTAQVSGTTPNNFGNDVVYTVTAADASTVNYTVTVTIAPISSAKAITAYSFTSPAATGAINETAKTIAVTVPNGTTVTALVATFTLSPLASATVGATPQVSGTTPNDFTGSVVYTVTAQDASTVDYTVTVTIATGLTTVLYANFQTLPAGMVENTDILLTSPVAVPTVTNTNGYTINLAGKLKVNTTQAPPGGSTGGTNGCVQFANDTSSYGQITIGGVTGPFTIKINHAPSSSGDSARKLLVMINSTQVYYEGNGNFETCEYAYTGTDTVGIIVYGWNGAKGAGVRVFDLWISK
jgi:hypothetical protein